jgi:hypothetical protein
MRRMRSRGLVVLIAATSSILGLSSVAAQAAVNEVGTAQAARANTFVPTASMNIRRTGATATLLNDGDVLVAGGGTASAELYDPGTGTWLTTACRTAMS